MPQTTPAAPKLAACSRSEQITSNSEPNTRNFPPADEASHEPEGCFRAWLAESVHDWENAAFNQAGAQFNPIGSSFPRSNTGLQRFRANLKMKRSHEEPENMNEDASVRP